MVTKLATISLRSLHLTPAVRVSLGLSSLLVAIVLVLDIIFEVIPDQTSLLRQVRERTSENLAIVIAVVLRSDDSKPLFKILHEAIARETQILSIAVRRENGVIVAQAGDHSHHWAAAPNERSSLDHIRVPLLIGNERWGDVEISFRSATPHTLIEWLRQPSVFLILTLGLSGFVLFALYLRRVLEHLDPSTVIPDRVRQAFDSFSEGVMVVDPAGRIMLANAAFRSWVHSDSGNLHGRRAHEIPWLKDALPGDQKKHPWMIAMGQRRPEKGEYLEFKKEGGEEVRTIVNCAPILDGRGNVRGCIVTFDNVTELERINRELMAAMTELQNSRAQIAKQNEDLRRLATRDSLTGCLNRRAFHEQLEKVFVEARDSGRSLSCIMTDIDYFKSFNDRYGHAVGDTVLQTVARFLFGGLRENDLLCRYGGEEFCIILPDVTAEGAQIIAERLRSSIETRTAMGIRSMQTVNVTSSFGIASLTSDVSNPSELIERADKALYAAKESGRNCVKFWHSQLQTASI
ncbi:MAG: diguanylate cyclase [Burkholderiales bacterium]